MVTKIQKWGNSLALRIPKAYAKEIKLEEGVPVNLKVEENKIIISAKKKKKKRRYTLEELVAGITPENRYKEIDVGSFGGKRGRHKGIFMPVKQWKAFETDYIKIRNRLRVLVGILNALKEVKDIRNGKKEGKTLSRLLREL